MKTHLFAATALAAAALLAGCSGGAGGNNSTAAAHASADLVKSAQALQAKLGAPGEKAEMPSADDPDVRAFDAQAEKALTALGTPAMPVQGLDSYERLCGPAANITAAYVSVGVGPIGSGGLPMDDQAKVAKMNANATRYLGQMLTPLLYSAHCTAVHMPAIEKDLATKDLSGKTGAVDKIRGGALSQAGGLFQMAASSDIKPDQRQRVVDLLTRDVGDFAVALSQAQRQQLTSIVDQAAAASPDVKAKADAMKASIAKAPCGKLCSA